MNRLRVGQIGECGSISGRAKIFFSSSKRPGRLSALPISAHWGLIPREYSGLGAKLCDTPANSVCSHGMQGADYYYYY
jgi:hypothetical protein